MRLPTRCSLGGPPFALLFVLWLCHGCSGSIEAGSSDSAQQGSPGGEGGTKGNPGAPGKASAACGVMAQRIYRLTPVQLHKTLAALLPEAAPDRKLILDLQTNLPRTQPFSNGEQILANNLGVTETLLSTVSAAAVDATKQPTRLAPCFAKGITKTCVGEMLTGLGTRAWRRPWTKDEQANYLAFFDTVTKQSTPEQALEFVVQRMLMAPDVLFRFETGEAQKGSSTFALTSYEMASALSYGLTDGPPDAELMQSAANNKLRSADEVRAAAVRILKTSTLAQGVQSFFEDFLSQGKPSPNADYAEQSKRFFEHALWRDGGSLSTLLTANYTFVNPALSKLMNAGVSVADGAWATYTPKVTSDAAGLLTLGLVLGGHTNQSARGRFISERLLCDPIPDPPNNVVADLDASKKALEEKLGHPVTVSEAREQHVSSPSCVFCHKILDPLGQPFVAYDRLGLWRAIDAETTKAYRTSATLDLPSLKGDVANARDLGMKLAASNTVKTCFVSQVFEYLQGRKLAESDACHVDQLSAGKAGMNGDVLGVFADAVASDAFRFRTAP